MQENSISFQMYPQARQNFVSYDNILYHFLVDRKGWKKEKENSHWLHLPLSSKVIFCVKMIWKVLIAISESSSYNWYITIKLNLLFIFQTYNKSRQLLKCRIWILVGITAWNKSLFWLRFSWWMWLSF